MGKEIHNEGTQNFFSAQMIKSVEIVQPGDKLAKCITVMINSTILQWV